MAFKRTNAQGRSASGFHFVGWNKPCNGLVALREQNVVSCLHLLNQVGKRA